MISYYLSFLRRSNQKRNGGKVKAVRAESGCLPQLLVVSSEQIFGECDSHTTIVGRVFLNFRGNWNCSTTNAICENWALRFDAYQGAASIGLKIN
jgi:hypothetical protein